MQVNGDLCFRACVTAVLLTLLGAPCLAQPIVHESAKLVPSDADSVATAGWSVGATADLVAVGAFRDATAGPQTGAAYVFRFDGAGWREEAKLTASDAQSYGSFGMAIDASRSNEGDVVLVGSPGANNHGTAYIYRKTSDNSWIEESTLNVAHNADKNPQFGRSVTINDNLALVFAFGNDHGSSTGSVYSFLRTESGAWVEEARLTASDGHEIQLFGRSLDVIGPLTAIGGAHLAIFGALGDATYGHQTGAAYIFRREPDGSWIEEAKLMAPDAQEGHGFGWSVAIVQSHAGDILAFAGAPTDKDVAHVAGAMYVFRRAAEGEWVFEAKLLAQAGGVGHRAGYSVSATAPSTVAADAIVMSGAPAAHGWTGQAHLFRRSINGESVVWSEDAMLRAQDGLQGDQLAWRVAASETMVVAGAPLNDPQGGPAGRGSAYVWELEHAVSTDPPDADGSSMFSASVYPNPVRIRATLVIDGITSPPVMFELFDAIGRSIRRRDAFAHESGSFEIPITNLRSGAYYIRLSSSNGSVILPLTVVN